MRAKPPIRTITALLVIFMLVLAPGLASADSRLRPITAGPPDPRFGAIETFDAPEAATALGAGWTRIPFLWAQMQPNGTHEWFPPISDEVLAREIAQGRQPVGLIITTPGWATDTSIGAGVPYGLHTGHNDPNNLWASFVRRLVTTYAGRIQHWIIWNEPDVWDAAHPGYTWGGSVEDMLQLQRVAYLAAKEANPHAQVIFSGTSYWWDAAYGRDLYFRRYLDALVKDLAAAGNNYYCDAVALHVYFQPDFVFSITALYHQLMREHGFDKPVWLVETNAAPSLDPQMPARGGRFAITLDEQAAYIVQAFAMAIAGGAARIGVFKTVDTPTDLVANPEPFGLVRADGSRRPAFEAYRVAATYLAGFQSGLLDQRPEVSIVTVTRTGGVTTVMWTRTPSPATVEVPAHTGSATLVDMWGSRRALSASGGVYTVALPGASCTHTSPCIIGGSPYLIVEGNVGAQPPAPAPATGSQTPPAAAPTTTSQPPPTPTNAGTEDTSIPTQEPGPTSAQPAPTSTQLVSPVLSRTPVPEYAVNLRPVEVESALHAWERRDLPGYQITLVSGPPVYVYVLDVVDERVTQAQRSRAPLEIRLEDLDGPGQWLGMATRDTGVLSTTMTTLYNRRALESFTVTGLFDQITRYYRDLPLSPACDTHVTVRFNGDWAFPARIIEGWDPGCQAGREAPWTAVVRFATLTPTPTRATPPTAAPSPTSTAIAAATARPSETALTPLRSVASVTATPVLMLSGSSVPDAFCWMFLVAVVAVAGAVLLQRGTRLGRNSKRN